MKREKTHRGFAYYEATDRYDQEYSIQKSSLATEDCIWFGVDSAKPKVMASEAAMVGVETKEVAGWVDYPIPKQVSLSTRMHLTVEEVEQIIPILQKFVDTGEI